MSQKIKTYAIHIGLFLLTLITTTYAGAEWQEPSLEGWAYFKQGLWFSGPLLLILACHEFGHYFFARKYKVDVSLPYFIPFLPIFIGTMGAVIRMRSPISSRKQIFDIGIAGPLSGLVVAVILLIVGFSTLPPREHIYNIHPDYKRLDSIGRYENVAVTYAYIRQQDSLMFKPRMKADSIFRVEHKNDWWMKFIPEDSATKVFEAPEKYEQFSMGSNLLFYSFGKIFADPDRLPPAYELVHNPILLAVFFALFFTALNLIPIGQLDGGHVIYGLFGSEKHFKISRVIFVAYIFIGGIGIFRNNLFNINVFQENLFYAAMFTGGYCVFLATVFSRTFKARRNAYMAAALVMAGQFLIEYLLPDWPNLHGWLLFGFLLGRFLGIHHPPAMIDEPLDMKRKVLGWSCIVIFILCFTPVPIHLMEIVGGK